MIIVNEKTIEVLKEFGRKTNPKCSEKIRAFKTLAIDCKYKKFEKMYVYNKVTNSCVPDIYANIKMRGNEEYKIEKDELIIVGINPKIKNENGVEKRIFSFNLSTVETVKFVENLESCISYAAGNLSQNEKEQNGNLFKIVIDKTEGNEDKKIQTINLQAKNLFKTFDDQKYLVIRRETSLKNGKENKEINGVFWIICGCEENTYASEAKRVADEFEVIPLTSASGITEIIPR